MEWVEIGLVTPTLAPKHWEHDENPNQSLTSLLLNKVL